MIIKIYTKHGELVVDKILRVVVEDDYKKPLFAALELDNNKIQLARIGDSDFDDILKIFNLKSPKLIEINDLNNWKSLNKSSSS
jgi:hypothetical protein